MAEEDLTRDVAPPVFIEPLSSQVVIDGSPVQLDCKISGWPRPNITWFRESTLLRPSPDFMQFYDEDNLCSLVIKEVYPEDNGRYTVVAKNLHGTATCSCDLIVEGWLHIGKLYATVSCY